MLLEVVIFATCMLVIRFFVTSLPALFAVNLAASLLFLYSVADKRERSGPSRNSRAFQSCVGCGNGKAATKDNLPAGFTCAPGPEPSDVVLVPEDFELVVAGGHKQTFKVTTRPFLDFDLSEETKRFLIDNEICDNEGRAMGAIIHLDIWQNDKDRVLRYLAELDISPFGYTRVHEDKMMRGYVVVDDCSQDDCDRTLTKRGTLRDHTYPRAFHLRVPRVGQHDEWFVCTDLIAMRRWTDRLGDNNYDDIIPTDPIISNERYFTIAHNSLWQADPLRRVSHVLVPRGFRTVDVLKNVPGLDDNPLSFERVALTGALISLLGRRRTLLQNNGGVDCAFAVGLGNQRGFLGSAPLMSLGYERDGYKRAKDDLNADISPVVGENEDAPVYWVVNLTGYHDTGVYTREITIAQCIVRSRLHANED